MCRYYMLLSAVSLVSVLGCGPVAGMPTSSSSSTGGDVGGAGGGGAGASGGTDGTGGQPPGYCSVQSDCTPPADPRCAINPCGDDHQCHYGNVPKDFDCDTGMVCDGNGACVKDTRCKKSEDCDDGNPCTNDVCDTYFGTCGHIPTAGYTSCPGGTCLAGTGTCCAGCNHDKGDGTYECVSSCPFLSVCVDGYCT